MKRLIIRTVLAGIVALVFVQFLLWYSSAYRHVPEEWPRVYLASDCPASEFAMWFAEHSSKPVVTIPIDDGGLSDRACRHTVELLADQSTWWGGARLLPERLVCDRMIQHGTKWMAAHRLDEWPVFVDHEGEVHLGADIEGVRMVRADLGDEEYERMKDAWMDEDE